MELRKRHGSLRIRYMNDTRICFHCEAVLRSSWEDEKTSNVSANIEVSSKSDGCEQLRRQKIGENLEFLPDKKICESRKEGINIIFEGNYKVPGAVKRLPKADYDVDANKIKLLTTQSQYLPNVVRYYGMECDDDQECFYLVTEQQNWGTTFNLDELIKTDLAINTNSFEAVTEDGLSSTSVAVLDDRLEAVKNIVGDFNLIPENGGRIPDLSYTLLREVLYGLVQLNDIMEISHGELKPENILIIKKESSWRVRLSDIDISKKPPTKSYNKSYSYLSGFIPARNDRGIQIGVDDMYAFGKLFSYCITGRSEFGDWRTVTNKRGSSLLNYPEAYQLYCCLSSRNPAESLTAKEALHHPHFWDPEKKLAFLRDSYNKVYEFEHSTGLLKELDSISWKVIEGKWKGENVKTWNKRIDGEIVDYAEDQLRKYSNPDSTYKYKSFPELLRFIRHMFVHYGRHPQNIQKSIGSLYKGFYDYFESKFPNLLIEVYKAVKKWCGKDEYFCRYFQDHN
ncbi:serine/threonine-protein kinase/endoribonuclease IRE1a [Morus notabilis]|uniref:serine/threonine-protein kinase/endoribonuclease IRE1a n=1 Tax=Morus notabilis TaxID=981085 RepID=UPI000CED09AF|nr:serine/threonine-protein kinase/endoribonuclease IRE1a [Morus notabilis]